MEHTDMISNKTNSSGRENASNTIGHNILLWSTSHNRHTDTKQVTPSLYHQAKNFFPFLELPVELRNIIYGHVLTSSKPRRMLHYSARRAPTPSSCLALLEVCRQIYEEAFHLFYRENTLKFETTGDLNAFLYHVGYARRQGIRSIEFFWAGSEPKYAFRMLKTCQRLEKIAIENSRGGQRRSGEVALREVRGLKIVQTFFQLWRPHDSGRLYS